MTYVKKLVMKGFKSFARETSMEMDRHVNVIVGPNGSGKSNVTDALCFVLGRLSIKSMRAAKASHLIFSGNKTFKGAKEAYVEVVFDNSEKTFALDSKEIIIRRIVRKNGQSVYKINNETKTRQEVLELLNQAGIDPHGFNIILQGEIEKFVKMPAEDRRKVIEEVAGISVYEMRKTKSLKELEKTEIKLKQIDAILRERTNYLRNLEDEREQALRFKKLEETLKKCKASIINKNIQEQQKQLSEVLKKIEIKKKETDKKQEIINKTQDEINLLNEKIDNISKTVQKSSGFEQDTLTGEISTLKQEYAGMIARKENFENQLVELDRRKQTLQDSISTSEKEIEETESVLRSIFESKVIYVRPALFQQAAAFTSTSPYGMDLLQTHTPMNTEPLSSIFPFISFDLTSSDGILYGVNKHNRSLVLFDRFSLENANAVIFGTSGAGKSYLVKLDVLRSLMSGIEVIIVDPENEYRTLAESVGGAFFNISLGSSHQINPFDIPIPGEGESAAEVLRTNTINLVGLLRIMLKGLGPEEDALIDQAITETYAARDITPESDPNTWADKVPLLSDLEQILESMEGTRPLVLRLRRFTQGTYSNFFNHHTNISVENNLTVFGIRDLEDEMRPIAMFIIMRYIWKTVSSSLKKRLFVIDEAWLMMQNEDGASFLFGLVKRARKYWLGVTTITQDVSDFMQSGYGKPIVTNSALKILLKQSSAVIDMIQKVFNLTEEEKFILLEGEVGEGIFFAGQKHVAIKITASYTEDQIITSSPEEIEKMKKAKARF